MRAIPPSVKVVRTVFGAHYPAWGGTWDTRVSGISTATVASRFRAGESLQELAADYKVSAWGIADAIRWELLPRSTRVRLVRRAVERGEAK